MSKPNATAAAARSSRVSDNGTHYTVALDLAGSDRATVDWYDVPYAATIPVRCHGVVLCRYTVTCDEHPGFSATLLLGSPESDPYGRPHTGTRPDSVYVHSLTCTWTGVVDATWRLPVTKLRDAALRAGVVQGVWYPAGVATPTRSATSNSQGTIALSQAAFERGPIASAADWVDRWETDSIDAHTLAKLAGRRHPGTSSTDPDFLQWVYDDVLPDWRRLKSTDSLPTRSDGKQMTQLEYVTHRTGYADAKKIITRANRQNRPEPQPVRKSNTKLTGARRRQTRKTR